MQKKSLILAFHTQLMTLLILTEALIYLTKRQFEACVKQHQVQGGVFCATDLIVSHDDLRVQGEPFPRTLLHTQQHLSTQTHQGNPAEDHLIFHQL